MNNLSNVISNIENNYNVKLKKVPRKRVVFEGITINNKRILVITPESKIHVNNNAWIDLTSIQKQIFQQYEIGILAFRLKNGQIFYLNFKILESLLTKETLLINNHEGKHWKLHISPILAELKVQGSYEKIQLETILK